MAIIAIFQAGGHRYLELLKYNTGLKCAIVPNFVAFG